MSIHKNDHYRIIRAYEYHQKTGNKMSLEKSRLELSEPYNFETNIHNFDFINFYLDLPKPIHFEYIQKRTDEMITEGLIDEVKDLLSRGFSENLKPLQSIGYKETVQYLNGNLKDIEELKDRISISTRQLAKSQRTFFNKISPKIKIDPINDFEKLCTISIDFIKSEKY
jgi:tRNA dimethylallyltransferase